MLEILDINERIYSYGAIPEIEMKLRMLSVVS